MFGIGMSEMIIILAVALLVFGPQKLPEIAKGIAKGLRELRRAGDDLRASVDFDDAAHHPRPSRRTPPRHEPALEEAPAQIPGSDLTASTPAESAGDPPPPASAEAPSAPLWPQPADGTQAQGSLEGEMAPEGSATAGEQPPDAPPSEAKGT